MRQILPKGFQVQGDNLFWNNIDIVDLGKKYGTPLIIYSKKRIADNYERIYNAFKQYSYDFSIRYAIKANGNPTILSIISRLGAGADTSSYHEIMLAINSGFSEKLISFTPNNVSPRELLFAIEKGITINFDSIGQFMSIEKKIPEIVSFRIKIKYGKGEFKGTTTSGYGSKFGETIENAILGYKRAKKLGCNSFGIHVMAGSNITDPDHFTKVTEEISDTAIQISKEVGIKFDYLDIGGGFGVPYRPEDNELNIDLTAKNIFSVINSKFEENGLPIPKLIIEPGRYIVADAGLLLGKVYDVKKHEKNYVGTDIGMNLLLRPAIYGAYHHIVVANKMNADANFLCDITGQICENTDRIAKDITIPEPIPGDIIAVFDSGAYVRSMASNYNGRGFPSEILIDDKEEIIITQKDNSYFI